MARARKLLASSSLAVEEIALKSGFASVQAFRACWNKAEASNATVTPAYAGTTTAGYWQASRHVQACCGLSPASGREEQTIATTPSERSDAFRARESDLRYCRRAAQPKAFLPCR
ncbi:hypothetical protein D9M69_533810 [compost metagenome]